MLLLILIRRSRFIHCNILSFTPSSRTYKNRRIIALHWAAYFNVSWVSWAFPWLCLLLVSLNLAQVCFLLGPLSRISSSNWERLLSRCLFWYIRAFLSSKNTRRAWRYLRERLRGGSIPNWELRCWLLGNRFHDWWRNMLLFIQKTRRRSSCSCSRSWSWLLHWLRKMSSRWYSVFHCAGHGLWCSKSRREVTSS